MKAKAAFATFATSSGATVQRLALEAFPGFWAYAYVVRTQDLSVLIDAGSGLDKSHQNLLDGLAAAGLHPSDLTHILLTHAHIDHYGGLSPLRPLTRAQIGVHELDLQAVAHHEARLALIGRRLSSFLAETGLPPQAREQILGIYRLSKGIYRSTPVDFTYDSVDMRPGPLEFIHLPGHGPGHVAIRLDDVVFCGDMVVEGVTPHLAPESLNPWGGLDHYLESLGRLQHWARGARLILNGHDEAITDLPAIIRATQENILRRIARGLTALAEPLTIEEACTAIYGETQGYNQLLVIEKTGAYIEYLYEHCLIEITNPADLEQGGPARYRRLGGQDAALAAIRAKFSVHTGAQVQL